MQYQQNSQGVDYNMLMWNNYMGHHHSYLTLDGKYDTDKLARQIIDAAEIECITDGEYV